MPVKLSDKEISALAKKIADKKRNEATRKLAETAKSKTPRAKQYMDIIKGLPEEVIDFIDDTRYSKKDRTVAKLAERLARKEETLEKIEDKSFEPDIVLTAHDCTSLAQLCKKLGI